jgi:DNA-directed RNA polymerase beta subunit
MSSDNKISSKSSNKNKRAKNVERLPAAAYQSKKGDYVFNANLVDPNDLPLVIDANIDKRGLVGHHIESFNSFTSQGMKQIVTQLFKAEVSIQNERTKTQEDQEIESINVVVAFTDSHANRPTTSNYYAGKQEDLKPLQARLNKLNYSGPLYIDAEITATAYLKDGGQPRVRKEVIRNHRIASIPVMIGSQLCHTAGMPRMAKQNIGEDPQEEGGYFIVKGGEWVVDMIENRVFNAPHTFRNVGHEKEITRLEFISKPGDAFENSSEHIIRYVQNGNIYITLTSIEHFKLDVPFYIFFRMLGMVTDQEIFDNIIYGYSDPNKKKRDVVSDHMFQVLEGAIKASDPTFNAARNVLEPSRLVETYADITSMFLKTYDGKPIKMDAKNKKYLCSQIITLLDKWLLPHIGTTPDTRHAKLRYLGHLIHKMLLVEMQIVESTDRDSQKNKRINAAGRAFAKAFKRDFNLTIVMPIKKKLKKDFKNISFSQVPLAQSLVSAIDAPALEKALIQAIVTGDKEITIKNRAVPNRLASEMLHRKNQLNFLSTLRVVRTASTSASKQDARADEMRRVHPSYTGYLCPIQSADTGEQVGMVKQFSLDNFLSEASSSELLKSKLLQDTDILPLNRVYPVDIYNGNLTKILVNGDWIGCTDHAALVWYRLREYRRGYKLVDFKQVPTKHDPLIDVYTTIHWDTDSNEINFWVDAGRMLRPLLIVRNNGELDPLGRALIGSDHDAWAEPAKSGFIQDIVLNKDMITKLKRMELGIDDLYALGVIDYISPEEEENTHIAADLETLRQHQTDPLEVYTHVEIPACIMGLAALTSPHAHHNQPPRITFQTNQTKQTCGWYSLSWPFRVDKHAFLQYYCELPIIKTIANKYVYPNGMNGNVAIMSYTGSNQEDSLIYNISAAQRGYVKGVAFGFIQAELEKNEHFGNPDQVHTIDIKNHANYAKLVKGFPAKGTQLTAKDVAIGRFTEIPKPTDRRLYKDTSVLYGNNEPGTVEAVIRAHDQEGTEFAKVKYSAIRELGIGSKFSSRHGQKGVTGLGLTQADMAFDENGMSPVLKMNPHALPSQHSARVVQ